jgi:hypothetical protein
VSRDQLLGRARRAVLAVAGTAGALGGRPRRRQTEDEHTGRQASSPRPAPTPGLPPRIDRERTPGLPPRIDREPKAGLPPRIEREPTPGLPPRIEHGPEPPPPPGPATREPVVAAADLPVVAPPAEPEPAYQPTHAAPDAPEPAPVRYSPGTVRAPDPVRSPLRAAMRSHLWLTGIILTVLAVGATGYWVLRVHQRIAETSLEHQIAAREHAPTVRCSALQSDGAAWACAVVYRVESVCLIAKVSALGNWSTVVGQHRCERLPELAALLPRTLTAAAVGADIGRQAGHSDFICRKLPSHKVRWACGRPPAPGGQCLIVRVVVWTPWVTIDGGRACDHFPALQSALRRSVASKA